MRTFAQRLAELGLSLQAPAAPVANYVPYKSGLSEGGPGQAQATLVYTSGMIPTVDGKPICTGKLGGDVSIEQGQLCARQCVLNAFAWLGQALDSRFDERLLSVVQLRVFVACTPDFHAHPQVANGASDLLVALLDDRGRHTRAAVGCPSLPLNVPVEIDFLFAVR